MCADTKDRETFGSLWTTCAGDQPTDKERRYFQTWKTGAETLSVNLRLHVQDSVTGGKSIYNGADAQSAKVRMADALRSHLAGMLMDPIGSQQVRRSSAEGQEVIFYVTASLRRDVAQQHPCFQAGLRGLNTHGVAVQMSTMADIQKWQLLPGAQGGPEEPVIRVAVDPVLKHAIQYMAFSMTQTVEQLQGCVGNIRRAEEASVEMRRIPNDSMGDHIAIYSCYHPFVRSSVTVLFPTHMQVLSQLIMEVPDIGVLAGTWSNTICATPLKTITPAVKPGLEVQMLKDLEGHPVPLPFEAEATQYQSSWIMRYLPFKQGADGHGPGTTMTARFTGENADDIRVWAAVQIAETFQTRRESMLDMPESLTTSGFWLSCIVVWSDRWGQVMRLFVATVQGWITAGVIDALQDELIPFAKNENRIRLAFALCRCNQCAPGCYRCGKATHPRGVACPNIGLALAYRESPCPLCREPTGGNHTHTLGLCDAMMTLNDPNQSQRRCGLCGHMGHGTLQCPALKDHKGVLTIPDKFTQAINTQPGWSVVLAQATASTQSKAWINTPAHEWQSVTPVKCHARTYSQRVQNGSSPAGSSASGSDGAITLQMGGEGQDWQLMGQRMIDSIAGLSTLVQSVKEEQAGQALILGILGDTAKANTSAIETIQTSQAAALTKQQEFIADLQRVREMAENANQRTAQLLASPGKDPKKGGRQ